MSSIIKRNLRNGNASFAICRNSFSVEAKPTITHTVFNQSSPLVDYNVYESDPSLRRAINAFCPNLTESARSTLKNFGKIAGSASILESGDLAEKNRPTLRQFDVYGRRIDVIDYHPSYHILMKNALGNGVASYGYNNSSTSGSHVVRAGLCFMNNQIEQGHQCPVTMTSAVYPVLKKSPYCQEWAEKVCVQDYDPRNVPISEKKAISMGMSMTEKQGGSDVRSNTTLAVPLGSAGPGEAYSLRGHKWFTSAAMSDGFLTLAKTDPSLKQPPSCFLVPRWLPDGSRNEGFRIMRLKEKCADRANASSEIEYDGAWGLLISEEGKGVKTIIDMVQATRLDCALGSSGMGRKALTCALNHAAGRQAFGKVLLNLPLMENVLADLCVESEVNTLMALRMAAAYDRSESQESTLSVQEKEREIFRVGVAVTKYYVTKRLPQFVYECMEVYGGGGFVEDLPMAKLFRHSPLNAIWEGSGNVIALDILRAASSLPILLQECHRMSGQDAVFDEYLRSLQKDLAYYLSLPADQAARAGRHLADRLALALQAAVVMEYGNPLVAQSYLSSRLKPHHFGENYGSFLYSAQTAQSLIQENLPQFY